jgi:hypothetical protein
MYRILKLCWYVWSFDARFHVFNEWVGFMNVKQARGDCCCGVYDKFLDRLLALAFAWRNHAVEYHKMCDIQGQNQTWDLASAKPERKR